MASLVHSIFGTFRTRCRSQPRAATNVCVQNHSCDPNCAIIAVYINEANIEKPLLAIFTQRDVEPYEEICFSYMGNVDDSDLDSDSDDDVRVLSSAGCLRLLNGRTGRSQDAQWWCLRSLPMRRRQLSWQDVEVAYLSGLIIQDFTTILHIDIPILQAYITLHYGCHLFGRCCGPSHVRKNSHRKQTSSIMEQCGISYSNVDVQQQSKIARTRDAKLHVYQ